MTEPISIQWPGADTLRFGKRADADSEAITITKDINDIALSAYNNSLKCISVAGRNDGSSYINMSGAGKNGVLLEAAAALSSKLTMYGNETSVIEMNATTGKTADFSLKYNTTNCLHMQTNNNSTAELRINGAGEERIALYSINDDDDNTGAIELLYNGDVNLGLYSYNDATAEITLKTAGSDMIHLSSKTDGTGMLEIGTTSSQCITIMSLTNNQSNITLRNDGSERIYIGTELDDDNEYNYVKVEHNRSGYYTALDERGLLIPTKFADPSSTEPGDENETRIQAFDSDFLSYANNNQEKIDYLKRTVPSSYAVSSAIKAIQPFNVYPFEFIVTDSDSEGNAEFKIRYYYQDGTNRYRDFTLNYADKQGSPSTAFDAAPVTLTGIDKYVARVNSLIAGGSGSAIIADETFDSQRTLAWNYSSSVPVDIEFINCTFTNDSLVSLFAAVAGQSSPVNFSVKFTNCNCNAIIDMHSMFANLIDTTRLSIDGLKMSDSLKDIRRLFVYLGARTDGCDLVINDCYFGAAKGEYSVSDTTIDGIIDIYSWSKIRYINLEDIGLTNQTSNIGDGGGSTSHRIGRFEPNCDESAILPYYIPLTRVDVYGRAVRDVDEVTEIGLILNWPMNFNARDVKTDTGRNELHFTGLAMGIHGAIERNAIVEVPFYSVNELTIGDAWDGAPYDAGAVSISLNFNYPDNVSGITVLPKIDRFGFTLTTDEAKSAITRLIIHNGSTLVERFDNIQYNDNDTITVTVDEEEKEFSEWFNSQNYAFNLNNGDVYFELTNPSSAISDSFEFSSILSTKQ